MSNTITHSPSQNPYQNRVDPAQHPYAIKAKEALNSVIQIDANSVLDQSTQNLRSDKKILALQHLQEVNSGGASKFLLQNSITDPAQVQAVETLFTNLQSAINETSLKTMARSRIANIQHAREKIDTTQIETDFSRSINNALRPLDIRI